MISFIRTLACSYFLGTIAILCHAQTNKNSEVNFQSNRKLKNEIAIDVAPLKFIMGESSASYPSLFYRRHFIREKEVKSLSGIKQSTYHAYRIRIGSNLSFQRLKTPNILTQPFSSYYNPIPQYQSKSSSFFIRLGREKQQRYGRFELIVGYDFYLSFNKFTEYRMQGIVYGGSHIDFSNERWSKQITFQAVGLSGIAGLKYFLNQRFCLSSEAVLNTSYSLERTRNFFEEYYSPDDEYFRQSSVYTKDGVDLSIIPLFVIAIGFYF